MKESLSSRYVKLADRQIGLTKATDALLSTGDGFNLNNLSAATCRLTEDLEKYKQDLKVISRELHECLTNRGNFIQLKYKGKQISTEDLLFLAVCGLEDSEIKKKVNSLWMIGELSKYARSLYPNVVAAFEDPDNRVKGQVLKTLFKLGNYSFYDLVNDLENRGIYLEGNASGDLKRLGSNLAPLYAYSLNDENVITRRNAASNLSLCEGLSKELEAVLLVALNDEDVKVRASAIRSFAKVEGLEDKTVDIIVRYMQIGDGEEQLAAIKSLVDIGKKNSKFKPIILDSLERRSRKESGRIFSVFHKALRDLR